MMRRHWACRFFRANLEAVAARRATRLNAVGLDAPAAAFRVR
ncbi:MAG: hypothetical protein ACKV22_08920 [Bryobacteraceae bacterium]